MTDNKITKNKTLCVPVYLVFKVYLKLFHKS